MNVRQHITRKYVGVKGFEPSTPWSQTRCANRTALHPEVCAKVQLFTFATKIL